MNQGLIHSIESVVIEWSHQIQEVLKKDSSQPILEGLNPTPAVELQFWAAKTSNLESIYEQVNFSSQKLKILVCKIKELNNSALD